MSQQVPSGRGSDALPRSGAWSAADALIVAIWAAAVVVLTIVLWRGDTLGLADVRALDRAVACSPGEHGRCLVESPGTVDRLERSPGDGSDRFRVHVRSVSGTASFEVDETTFHQLQAGAQVTTVAFDGEDVELRHADGRYLLPSGAAFRAVLVGLVTGLLSGIVLLLALRRFEIRWSQLYLIVPVEVAVAAVAAAATASLVRAHPWLFPFIWAAGLLLAWPFQRDEDERRSADLPASRGEGDDAVPRSLTTA
jgi:hypothetical protein